MTTFVWVPVRLLAAFDSHILYHCPPNPLAPLEADTVKQGPLKKALDQGSGAMLQLCQ